MRIGILTLPLHTNYGGILQAYALQTVLERMGHEVEIINKVRYKEIPWYKFIFLYISRAFQKKILRRKDIHIFKERDYFRSISPKRVHVNKFIKRYMNIRNVCDMTEIREHDYDTIVVGSDQIWRFAYIESMLGSFFLSFARTWKINRVAYAASFGVDTWEFSEEDTLWIRSLVKLFKAISVREQSGVQLCNEFLQEDAVQVLDPTLLLTADDYNSLAKDSESYDGNLMCYILDRCSYKDSIVKKIANATKLKPFDTTSNDENEAQPPVEKWLHAFSQSEMVITDSFHACVFSIIFHKPFIAIANEARGKARFTSLLSMFDLEDRLIEEGADFSMDEALYSIDYTKVDELLNKWRALSLDFIKRM